MLKTAINKTSENYTLNYKHLPRKLTREANCVTGHLARAEWIDDVIKWKIKSALIALCEGNPPVTGGFPHKGQWRGTLIFSLICAWTNGLTNNRDPGDLRRHRARFDVTVMIYVLIEDIIITSYTYMTFRLNMQSVLKLLMASHSLVRWHLRPQWWRRSGPLHWHHNDHDGVSNHQPHDCLFNRLFRRRSKKTSKLRVTGFCVGNSPGPVNSPHKGPVTRKIFLFDDVIMPAWIITMTS